MYSDIFIFFFAIFFVFDNHVFQFILKTTLIISQGRGLFITRKDIKNSSNDTYDSKFKFIGNLNRITGNINSNDTYWVAQNFSRYKDVFKTSKKEGQKFSREHVDAKQKGARHKRQIFSDHPTHPTEKMNTDDIMRFQRKLSPDCKLTRRTFAVIKTSQKDGVRKSMEDRFTFYAISGRYVYEVPNRTRYDMANNRKYENQVAFIQCGPGWIQQLTVFHNARLKIENEEGELVDQVVNAQMCGIGVVLMELCLLDPDIFENDEHNRGKMELDNGGMILHENCDKLVGLSMASNRPGGGIVYLSAAIRIGYYKILIDQSRLPPGMGGSKGKQRVYNAYETQVAKDNFKAISGEIGPCAGYENSDAWHRTWYLCSERYAHKKFKKS